MLTKKIKLEVTMKRLNFEPNLDSRNYSDCHNVALIAVLSKCECIFNGTA
jgi:hypothetical protein